MKKEHPLRRKLEKLEIWFEDIVIIFLAIISILIIIAAASLFFKSAEIAKALNIPAETPIALMFAGYMVLPWLLCLALMIIARDLWIMRRILEKAVRFEAVLVKEVKEIEKEEKKIEKGIEKLEEKKESTQQ